MRYRSAVTGRFVSAVYARRHARTTVAEGRKSKRAAQRPRKANADFRRRAELVRRERLTGKRPR